MSGPIVRKYGFPNFDEIFGKKELEHGVEEAPKAEEAASKEVKTEAKKGRSSKEAKDS